MDSFHVDVFNQGGRYMTLEEYYFRRRSQLKRVDTEDGVKQKTVNLIDSDSKEILIESFHQPTNNKTETKTISPEDFFKEKGW